METNKYRNELIETINALIEIKQTLFDRVVNVGMTNELSDIDEVLETGEAFEFELSHFENSNDINLQKIVNLFKKVEDTQASLINLNNIQDNELNGFEIIDTHIEFKTIAKIVLANIQGVELNIDTRRYANYDYKADEEYCKLIGEYFYCGLLVDGEIIMTVEKLNEIINSVELVANKFVDLSIYFRTQNAKQKRLMTKIPLEAYCIGDEYAEDDDDENYIFILIE